MIRDWHINQLLPPDFITPIDAFDEVRMHRMGTFGRMGWCTPILPDCRPIEED